MAKIYNIKDQYKNDTFDGVRYTLIDIDAQTPINLTDVTIKIQFRYSSKVGKVQKEITEADGITIEDAVNGIFKIDPFIIDWAVNTYYYDIEITFTNGVVKTYVQGTLKVIQDITNG